VVAVSSLPPPKSHPPSAITSRDPCARAQKSASRPLSRWDASSTTVARGSSDCRGGGGGGISGVRFKAHKLYSPLQAKSPAPSTHDTRPPPPRRTRPHLDALRHHVEAGAVVGRRRLAQRAQQDLGDHVGARCGRLQRVEAQRGEGRVEAEGLGAGGLWEGVEMGGGGSQAPIACCWDPAAPAAALSAHPPARRRSSPASAACRDGTCGAIGDGGIVIISIWRCWRGCDAKQRPRLECCKKFGAAAKQQAREHAAAPCSGPSVEPLFSLCVTCGSTAFTCRLP
jgi:hypothetical protein